MAELPEAVVEITTERSAGAPSTDLGRLFLHADAPRNTGPIAVSDEDDLTGLFGRERPSSLLHAAVRGYLQAADGDGEVVVCPVVSTTATVASATLVGGANLPTFELFADGAGDWLNGAEVRVTEPSGNAGPFLITIIPNDSGIEPESSPELADAQAAVRWAERSRLLDRLVHLAGGAPRPNAQTGVLFAGGALPATVDADLDASLDAVSVEEGPGLVLPLNRSNGSHWNAAGAHAWATGRVALPHSAFADTAAALAGKATAVGGLARRVTAPFTQWVDMPVAGSDTPDLLPFALVEAGLIARVLAAFGPQQPAAGRYGIAPVDRLRTEFTRAERDLLNDTGVNVALLKFGDVRAYGYRTLATAAGRPERGWSTLVAALVLTEVRAVCQAAAEEFGQFIAGDGGSLVTKLNGELSRLYRNGRFSTKFPEQQAYTVGAPVRKDATTEVRVSVIPAGMTEKTVIRLVNVDR